MEDVLFALNVGTLSIDCHLMPCMNSVPTWE
jgi:hypothetical protein